ncbi:hypothetical protein JK636_00925 [Clostridium sp. YIM B02515]|uniref:DUF4064 domain-containing protein n=1 Tax=Clostridium rhizosphaerae TaxID=2803861 RepID=A0ABS1T8H1_9CLOT|nr:hypothetical protein [Clostridium rhizosphaerae]MBL4934313.1 hypothetical protein [Clostridium rhizosphaerae]
MKVVYRFLFALQLFVGIGAIGGGMMAILNPQGPGGMPADALKNSPFNNYLIPGIILFSVIGLGSIFSSVMIYLRSKFIGYISSVFSWALVIWIIVQCIMLNAVVSLHVIFFIIGLVEAALSAAILFEQRLFPANIILRFYKRMKE